MSPWFCHMWLGRVLRAWFQAPRASQHKPLRSSLRQAWKPTVSAAPRTCEPHTPLPRFVHDAHCTRRALRWLFVHDAHCTPSSAALVVRVLTGWQPSRLIHRVEPWCSCFACVCYQCGTTACDDGGDDLVAPAVVAAVLFVVAVVMAVMFVRSQGGSDGAAPSSAV